MKRKKRLPQELQFIAERLRADGLPNFALVVAMGAKRLVDLELYGRRCRTEIENLQKRLPQ